MDEQILRELTAAISAIPGWDHKKVARRPLSGGLMNSNWLLTYEGRTYFLKMFGKGSESFIDRRMANEAATNANALGISPRVEVFDPEAGIELFEFLDGYRPSTAADFQRKDFLGAVVNLFQRFNSGKRLPVTKDVFAMTDEHIEQGHELGAVLPADFGWLLYQYRRAKSAFMASGLDIVPCHNDAMAGNFMVTMSNDMIRDMKLIDFEFASNNERAYEIGAFLGEYFTDEATMIEMVERYYGEIRNDLVARVWVARAVSDMKWGSWAVQQRQRSSWDFDYQKYGIWKYARARTLFNDPRWNDWLRQI